MADALKSRSLDPFKVFNEVLCLLIRVVEIELSVVVLNYIRESGDCFSHRVLRFGTVTRTEC